MFIGHFGVGLGTKRAVPKVSLGTLFLAAQFLDLLWPTFLLLGWEQVEIQPGNTQMAPLNFTHYPISHSLLMACLWGILVGGIFFLIKRKKIGALVLGLCVVSHWVLDLLVHRPDLPLYPGGSIMAGFGLWNYPVVEIIIEGLIFFIGLWLYLQATESKNKVGTYGFWALIIFLLLVHVSNIFGSPPPNTTAIAWAGQSQWILVIWAYWVDHNRSVAGSLQTQPTPNA